MIKGINELRAVAFLLVFLFHCDYAVFGYGWVGVQLFFVISGFLITRILVDSRKTASSGGYFKNFYGRRALRIFPLYYFYLGLLTILGLISLRGFGVDVNDQIKIFLRDVPYALTYTYNFFTASSAFEGSRLLTHLWSLAVEEQFYLVWPLLILWVPPRHLKLLFVSILVLAPLGRLALWLYLESANPSWAARPETVIYVLTTSHFDAFAIGGLFSQIKIPRPLTQAAIGGTLWIGLAMYLDTLSATPVTDFTLGMKLGLQGPGYRFIWGYSVLNYVLICTLIGCISYATRTGRKSSTFDYLGRISYGLYVYHFVILGTCKTVARAVPAFPMVASWALALAITIAVSAVSFRFLENPINQAKGRLFPKAPPGRSTTV
jgi:peptidoglycan/LPS O-acetylase OafA/YrhL